MAQILKFSADKIFTSDQKWSKDKVILTHQDGTIIRVDELSDHDATSIRFVKGGICPGFVNGHCHLELSHMKGKVDTGTTLLPFLNQVVKFRDIDKEVIDDAILCGDEDMYNNGIVAVGDISNKLDTASVKSKSKINYYTFVEMFDFLQPSLTDSKMAEYRAVYLGQISDSKNRKSYVPHAPYTVTPALFRFINESNTVGQTISIHNQETLEENQLFENGESAFIDFYKGFGMSLDHFLPIGKSSIHYTLEHLAPIFKTIFVHNTMTKQEDIKAAKSWNKNIYWATCPNANLYIENRLPDYKQFLVEDAKVIIGTDSLTSNWQLSIWEEIKTIKKYASYLSLEQLMTWATINGAAALGYDDRLGSIEIGKNPGLVALSGDLADVFSIKVSRLI